MGRLFQTKQLGKLPTNTLAVALDMIDGGIPVFPLLADKSPACEGGFRAATLDPAEVRRLFALPGAELIGVPTGAASGLDVLDLDPRHGSDAWAAENLARLPATRIHRTRSGGLHVLFRAAEGLRCAQGAPAPGLDVRAAGGYVVWWPASGGDFEGPEVPAEWPAWLLHDIAHRQRTSADTARTAADVAAPSAAAVVDLLNRLPNPLEADRGLYLRVMLGAVGAWKGLEAADRCTPEDALAIREAAVAWAERWEGGASTGEAAKWDDDFSIREAPLAGWRTLQTVAGQLIPGYGMAQAQAEFAALPLPDLAELPAPPSLARRPALRMLTPAECAGALPRGYVIKGLLAPRDVGCIFGPPGAGKSIIAPHLAYAVAQGRPAFGRRVKQGLAFYIPAEDSHGMRQRVSALRLAHGDAPGFRVVEGVSDLFSPHSPDPAALRKLVREHRPALVVLDTVAAAFPGMDENTSQGMGTVVSYARSLTEWGAAVVLIHHDTKAQDGTPRGHSILNGALDVALRLAPKDDSGVIRGKLSKNRNGSCDVALAFRINAPELGKDEDSDPITAPIAAELRDDAGRPEKLPRTEAAALDVLREMVRLEGQPQPDGRRAVPETAWRDECDNRRVSTSDSPKNRRDVLSRAYASLRDKGLVGAGGGLVWLPGDDDEFPPLEFSGDVATETIAAIVAR